MCIKKYLLYAAHGMPFWLRPKTPIQQPLRNITRQHEKQIKSEPLAHEPTNERTNKQAAREHTENEKERERDKLTLNKYIEIKYPG